jgi:hypothetical protein
MFGGRGPPDKDRPLPVGTVGFLLTDAEGSTPRWDRDPDRMALVMDRQEVIVHWGECLRPERAAKRPDELQTSG